MLSESLQTINGTVSWYPRHVTPWPRPPYSSVRFFQDNYNTPFSNIGETSFIKRILLKLHTWFSIFLPNKLRRIFNRKTYFSSVLCNDWKQNALLHSEFTQPVFCSKFSTTIWIIFQINKGAAAPIVRWMWRAVCGGHKSVTRRLGVGGLGGSLSKHCLFRCVLCGYLTA